MAKKRRSRLNARNTDKYALYMDAVQSPVADAEFVQGLYERLNGRSPVLLREDFCGTAAVSCQWIFMDPQHRAIGVDIDAEPLKWARENYLSLFPPDDAKRLRLRRGDVLRVKTEPADIIVALNFSFCIFKERKVLLRYFRRCREALRRGGVLVMDLYGGPESQIPGETTLPRHGYKYIWDQCSYNPVTAEVVNHIHFKFPDGSRKRRAFSYDWRLWTPPELLDALNDAGFREARVYWESRDRDGNRLGVYRHRRRVDSEEAWVAYIVGLR